MNVIKEAGNKKSWIFKIICFFFVGICLCAIGLNLTGCIFDSKSTPATEMSEEEFSKQLEKYGVELQTYQGSLADGNLHGGDAGSQEYETLLQGVTDTYTIKSVKETEYYYRISSNGETIENKQAVSTADQTPDIYLLKGNTRYSTGKCSNVCAIKGNDKSQITIQNCIFENMSGISLYNCSDVVIKNCYFKGAENGIYMTKCTNISVINCTFEMNSTGLTDYYQGVYLGDGNDYVTVSNCYFRSDGDIKKPFRVGSTSSESVASKNVTFEGCVSEGYFRSGFQNIDGEALLKDCVFIFSENSGSYGSAVVIDSDQVSTTLQNCRFYSAYRKKLSTSSATTFENCSYGLFES